MLWEKGRENADGKRLESLVEKGRENIVKRTGCFWERTARVLWMGVAVEKGQESIGKVGRFLLYCSLYLATCCCLLAAV